jgi:hypothetical protein
MHIVTTTTTQPHTAARGEPIGVFDSNGEDNSTAPERDPAAKNVVLPRRVRCLGPSAESLNMNARQPHPCLSSLERRIHDGRRDSFRSPGCAGAVRSWHSCQHWGNSNRARRCSFRSQDHTARRRQTVEHTPPNNRSTVVVGIGGRIVSQNGSRMLADSELDDDPSSDQAQRELHGHLPSSHGFSRN